MGAINIGHPNIGAILIVGIIWGTLLYCVIAGIVDAIRHRGEPEPQPDYESARAIARRIRNRLEEE